MTMYIEGGKRFLLNDPKLVPNSAGYLWNKHMMIHMNCQGYAVAQYMNPEPKKYAHAPNLTAKSFMQPEQPYFANHPGRFFYIRDDETGDMFSAPYAPMKTPLQSFEFLPGLNDICWRVKNQDISLEITLTLGEQSQAELWHVKVINSSNSKRKLSLVPYFPVGYMSWMNMGAHYDHKLKAVVCTSITPYQKLEDYEKNKHLKDITYFASDCTPNHFETSGVRFEGLGGLHNPDALSDLATLSDQDCHYEMPACAMQFQVNLKKDESKEFNFVFGPALDKEEIQSVISQTLGEQKQEQILNYTNYIQSGRGVIKINTPDDSLNHFINHWLPRQVFYHGDTNRLTTDPQTRNYLQDGMGMAYIDSSITKKVILTSLSQQKHDGEMPDGILLTPEAKFNYINQIPHTDHSVWLALIVEAYLNETNDWDILNEQVSWVDSQTRDTVLEHINRAMDTMCQARDSRGLPYIDQGDWCDPMNMVGHKGKGVSGWLAQALSVALQTWIRVSKEGNNPNKIRHYQSIIDQLASITETFLWQGDWYARGITDDGITFGIPQDKEGRIFLNTQSWAFLANMPNNEQKERMLKAIDEQLDTPFGVMLCAPAFTGMREDIGRVTQKWPGSGENGSVYNHAVAFYAASLYKIGEPDRAFNTLRKMIADPNCETFTQRGQLPIYVPNYYRGAYYQYPSTAGRSSNLFNTGTGAWFYQMIIEEMFGLKGCNDGLEITPKLPKAWPEASAKRLFRGASLSIHYIRVKESSECSIRLDGRALDSNVVKNIESGKQYFVEVRFK
ncbi:glycosyltransferase 36 [Marinomonas sp. SBI22]|uniref:GH36-type glycosyl hydrolase domain-containing protein n=1 Tax=unclassified Marinomonas TaxID=196814 RepID=UPI0007BB4012|nr:MULTISPECIES: glycosyltransferase 36 [unclassified Marinomonas]KZM44224.1 glycosyltransferase 36 [Marinomonas sp. SBI22]KZM45383.1 glycosyltransferase 36 [Marinomonas sp. SBI8L]